MRARLLAAGALLACAGLAIASRAAAQDIEPRTYSNAPIGVNFLIAGYAYTRGGLQFDSALDLTDAHLKTSNAVLGYARVFELGGQSATIGVVVPYTGLSGTAVYQGDPVERSVTGFANPALRLCSNLYGAPALPLKDFRAWQQDVIIGACVVVSAPWSQYDPSRLVNIGTNRWTFKPALGISKTVGPWTIEAAAGATIFTVNKDFYGGSWISVDATYFAGGRTTFNGVLKADLQQNWRVGATLAVPLDRLNSIKFYASSGLSDRTGNSFDLIGIAWQHRWGAGL